MCVKKIKAWWNSRKNKEVVEEIVDVPVVDEGSECECEDNWDDEVVGEVPGGDIVIEPDIDDLMWDDIDKMFLNIVNDYLGYGVKDYKKISFEIVNQVRDTYTKWGETKWVGLDFDIERDVVLGKDTDGDGDIEIAFRVGSVLQLEDYVTEFWIDLNIVSGLFSLKKIR